MTMKVTRLTTHWTADQADYSQHQHCDRDTYSVHGESFVVQNRLLSNGDLPSHAAIRQRNPRRAAVVPAVWRSGC